MQWNAAPDVNANQYDTANVNAYDAFTPSEWPATSQGNVGSYYDDGLNGASSSLALPSVGMTGYEEMVPMQVPLGQQQQMYDGQGKTYQAQQPFFPEPEFDFGSFAEYGA